MKRSQSSSPLYFGRSTQKVTLYAPTTALPYYRLTYRLGGKRIQRSFKCGSKAKAEAEAKRNQPPPARYLVKTYFQQYGPYSLKELRYQHSRGNFEADALVSVEGSNDWYDLNAKIDKL